MKDTNKHGWLPLSKINARTVVSLSGTPEAPGRHCPMHTALSLSRNLRGASTLVVGTAECGYYSRYVMTEPRGKNGELHYVYELDAGEVVFGCRKGLLKALQEMDGEGAEIILLILTCVPALIGEDMEAVIKELEGKISARLFFIDGAHFKYNGYFSGFLDTYSGLGLLNKVVDQDDKKYKNNEKSVNILGSLVGKEGAALKQHLEEAGCNLLEVNLQTIIKASEKICEGTLNVLLDPNQSQLSEKLEKPEVTLCRSFEAEAIRTDYQNLFRQLSIEKTENELLPSSYLELKEKEKQAKEVLRGVPFIMTCQELLALPAAAYLSELGMEPKLLSVERFFEKDLPYKQVILINGSDPYLVTITENNNIGHWAKELNILSIGQCLHIPKVRVLMNPSVQKIFSLTGYERSIELLNHMIKLVENMKAEMLKEQTQIKQTKSDQNKSEKSQIKQTKSERTQINQNKSEKAKKEQLTREQSEGGDSHGSL